MHFIQANILMIGRWSSDQRPNLSQNKLAKASKAHHSDPMGPRSQVQDRSLGQLFANQKVSLTHRPTNQLSGPGRCIQHSFITRGQCYIITWFIFHSNESSLSRKSISDFPALRFVNFESDKQEYEIKKLPTTHQWKSSGIRRSAK